MHEEINVMEETYEKNKRRGERRRKSVTKALRLRKIDETIYNHTAELGVYKKHKVHCSCHLCRAKTNHRKMAYGSGGYSDNYKHSDIKKYIAMKSDIKDFFEM